MNFDGSRGQSTAKKFIECCTSMEAGTCPFIKEIYFKLEGKLLTKYRTHLDLDGEMKSIGTTERNNKSKL